MFGRKDSIQYFLWMNKQCGYLEDEDEDDAGILNYSEASCLLLETPTLSVQLLWVGLTAVAQLGAADLYRDAPLSGALHSPLLIFLEVTTLS